MKYWIGVIGSKDTVERFFSWTDSWFCLPSSCEIGDFVMMYASKKAAGIRSGIFAAYEIKNKDESKDGGCYRYGIFSGTGERPAYVKLKIIEKFTNSISFKSIKLNSYLSQFVYVRRNFQATYFEISEKEYRALNRLKDKKIEII